MNRRKYTWLFLVPMSLWVTFAQAQQADSPKCSSNPAQLDANTKNINIPCVIYQGQTYQVDLHYKVAPDGNELWELPPTEVKLSNCTVRKSVCATVTDTNDVNFAALDVSGTIHTATLEIVDSSSETWRWRMGSKTPKWDFTDLVQQPPATTPNDFTMLFGSDVHVGICGDIGAASVIEQMKTVAKTNGNTAGLIFNGDMIPTGMATESLPLWKDLVKSLDFPAYEGLGNHDYLNYANLMTCAVSEFAEWGTDACTVMVLQYLDSQVANIPQIKWIDPKSRAYAFLLNGYLFVQFLYYPSFEQNIKDSSYSTQDSILWGKKLLAANAASLKAPVIVNVHDYFGHSNEVADIVSGEGGQYVVGVFSGHMHEVRGYVERIGDPSHVGNYDLKNVFGVKVPNAQGGTIPVWNSGSMTQLENYFTDCDSKTNTMSRTIERSFLEVKLSQQGYELKLWGGDRLRADYLVTWSW